MDSPTPALARTLQPRHVAMISIGGIIGAGLFVGSSAAINIAGPSVLITYALCGGLVFLIMRMLGEMAIAKPGLGSFSEYTSYALGHWAGFMTGWLYWYFWVITVGVETIAGAHLLHGIVPGETWQIGLVLISIMTASNLMSVRAYGEFEFWFAFLKIAAIIVFIVLGFGYILGYGPGRANALQVLAGNGGLFPKGIAGPFAAIPVVIFSMMGSEVASIAAAETADPGRNIARAARTVSLRILVFYVLSIAVIVSVSPWSSIIVGDSPFTQTLQSIHIPGAATAMSIVAITAVLSCLNSGLYVCSRMTYELARRGDAPALFARTSANQVPRAGILLGTLAGFLAALASIISPTVVFVFLIDTSGCIILFIYLLLAVAEIRMRQRGEVSPIFRMWLFPWLTYAVIAGIAAVLLLMATMPDQRSQVELTALSVGFIGLAFVVRRSLGSRTLLEGGAGA